MAEYIAQAFDEDELPRAWAVSDDAQLAEEECGRQLDEYIQGKIAKGCRRIYPGQYTIRIRELVS